MASHRMRTKCAFLPFSGPFRYLTPSLFWQGKQKAGKRLYRGIWDDFPHSDVWYDPASMINHTAAFEAYKRQLAEESR